MDWTCKTIYYDKEKSRYLTKHGEEIPVSTETVKEAFKAQIDFSKNMSVFLRKKAEEGVFDDVNSVKCHVKHQENKENGEK